MHRNVYLFTAMGYHIVAGLSSAKTPDAPARARVTSVHSTVAMTRDEALTALLGRPAPRSPMVDIVGVALMVSLAIMIWCVYRLGTDADASK